MDIQDPIVPHPPQDTGITNDASITTSSRRPMPAIKHLAVLTAFILPITLLPYVLTRRQTSLLRREIEELSAVTRKVQHELDRALSETASRKDDHRRIRGLLHDMMQETDEFRVQTEQRERVRANTDEEVSSELRKLVEEAQRARYAAVWNTH